MYKFTLLFSIISFITFGGMDQITYQGSFLNIPFLTHQYAIKNIEAENQLSSDLWSQIKFEDSFLLYDSYTNTFFITAGENFTGNFNISPNASYYWIEKPNQVISMVQQNQPLSLLVVMDGCYQHIEISVSTLPLISITADTIPTIKDDIYVDGTITVYDSLFPSYSETTYTMHYKVRGSSSVYYPKRSFKVELLKDNGDTDSESLLSLRKDDDWNLTALYGDFTKVRESSVLSLINQVANLDDDPYLHPQNAQLCELFINNHYWGIYALTEPMDEKQVDLNQSTDVMYKSTNNDWPTAAALEYYNTIPNIDHSIEVKSFPENMLSERYSPFISYLNLFNENTSYQQLSQAIHMENMIDHYIFSLVFSLMDNGSKNTIYNTRLQDDGTFQLSLEYFDFNQSFGDTWEGEGYSWANTQSLSPQHIEWALPLERGYLNPETKNIFLKNLVDRYDTLRASVLSQQNILDTINHLYSDLYNSGSLTRDAKRWYVPADLTAEYNRINTFVKEHLVYTDAYIDSLRN